MTKNQTDQAKAPSSRARISFRLIVTCAFLLLSVGAYAQCLNTATVMNTADIDASENPVVSSLRWAVERLNACPGPGVIDFDIPGTGPHRITLSSSITITEPILIDGFSESHSAPNTAGFFEAGNASLMIEVRGDDPFGFQMYCESGSGPAGSIIRGLVINGFTTAKIRNLGCDNVEISGNYIGTDIFGKSPVGGGEYGVFVHNARENMIGGALPAQRNVIAGHTLANVHISGNSSLPENLATGNHVRNNFIGTSASGLRPIVEGVQYAGLGIAVYGEGAISDSDSGLVNTIEDNLISGLSGYGIDLVGSTGTLIKFNALGTDSTIAPTMNALRNELPLPPPPVAVSAMGIGPAGVRIGYAGGRTAPTPSDDAPSTDNFLDGNAIHHGGGHGVLLESGGRNLLLQNWIYNNSQNGITAVETTCAGGITCVSPSGRWARNIITESGALDIDVKTVGPGPAGISIDSLQDNVYSGTINEGIGLDCRIEFFANDQCDTSGQGESQYYIGQQNHSVCPSVFSHNLGTPPYPGPAITATLTYTIPGGGSADTEISTESAVCIGNLAPTLENPFLDQMTDENAFFKFQFPANSFADLNGDTLTYAATLQGGEPLPVWLGFDAPGRTFSGTPQNQHVGSINLTVIATDSSGPASISDDFVLTINNVNNPPTAVGDSVETLENIAVLISVLSNDLDPDLVHGDALILVSVLPPTLGNAVIQGQQILYTPPANYAGSDQFEYTMQDQSGAQSSATVSVEIKSNTVFENGFETL